MMWIILAQLVLMTEKLENLETLADAGRCSNEER